ncbi:MAG: tRNA pseudouridine(38-40) synthase TruA [Gammaproteobacteria bacterium]|nr:MAG: tRNA pseudouridine(38-40) synthase TruA [Gammaproteobacteria bacterium]
MKLASCCRASANHLFTNTPAAVGTRLAAAVAYCGTAYNGWQAQPQRDVSTVQIVLEQGLSRVANTAVRVHCAGRTDTGVHASHQIVHFDAPAARSPKSWVMGANANMPEDVRLLWVQAVDSDFHARFSATARRYTYVIANTPVRPAHLLGQVTWCRHALDENAMHQAAQALLGEQDFSAFRAASCQSSTPMRNVHRVQVFRRGALLVIDIQANAFLHNMVRNIVGSLMAVGRGLQSVDWLAELLAGRDRTAAADTASPHGLYLAGVSYDEYWGLPAQFSPPIIISSFFL